MCLKVDSKEVYPSNKNTYNTDVIKDNFSIKNNSSRKEAAVKILKEKYGDKFE
jgi:hypothetical protein